MITTTKPKKYTYFIGIDVSRNELDFAVLNGHEFVLHQEIPNATTDILAFITELKALPKFTISKSIFCMEQTGIYCNHLLTALKKLKANIVQENALHIKNSMGVIRGKHDKVDAIRIAQYAYRNKDTLRFWIPRRPVLQQLAQLNSLRNRLLTLHIALKTPLSEQKDFVKKGTVLNNKAMCQRSMEAMKADIEEVDVRIDELIRGDEHLHRLYTIITSVPAVGRVTAIQLIISTNEYRDIRTAKKFACYAGVAPFKYESGTLQRKSKVSPIANKKMKALLHVCAISALQHDKEIKAYYQRKTKDENKPKMLVINAVRFKLISRIFACLAQGRCYQKEFQRPSSEVIKVAL